MPTYAKLCKYMQMYAKYGTARGMARARTKLLGIMFVENTTFNGARYGARKHEAVGMIFVEKSEFS